VDLLALDRLLDRTPVVAKNLHPVSVAFLREPARFCRTLEELAHAFDTLSPTRPERILTFDSDPRYTLRFPAVEVEHDPFTPELNRVLFAQRDLVATSMLTQAQVADRIVQEARKLEIVVLVLLDGLSYADCREWPGVEPCLATPPTVTRVGFASIIGHPPLAARLFSAGFSRRVGFTYWERRDEPLTNRLFQTIADTRRLDANKPNAFDQVLTWISAQDVHHTYVQIIRSALDDFAEGHRAGIPRQAIVHAIRKDLEAMLETLRLKRCPAALFGVADHGILWKEDNHDLERVSFAGARYADGIAGPGRGCRANFEDHSYWVLDYPQMGRAWRANEQGIHGGISFEESIVPFIHWEVN
jgi:hypothetical protein